MKNLTSIKKVLFGAALLGLSSLSSAIPTLQLGITGGTYDAASQTIFASSSSFSLYAYLIADGSNPITDSYGVSMAVTPQISSPANLGSFSVNGSPINVTADMVYGIPPLDATVENSAGGDSRDLQTHSIFPTYFTEKTFSFSSANTSGVFNTADHPSWGPQSGTGMYFQKFDIDVTNLDSNYAIHFDLYNTALLACKKNDRNCVPGNFDITQFAPFSHDAQSGNGGGGGGGPNEVPEPTPVLLLALGLFGLGLMRRKA